MSAPSLGPDCDRLLDRIAAGEKLTVVDILAAFGMDANGAPREPVVVNPTAEDARSLRVAMRERRDAIRDAQATESRRACGCTACAGGYDIGARTLGMQSFQRRPSSCLAPTFLAAFIEKGTEP